MLYFTVSWGKWNHWKLNFNFTTLNLFLSKFFECLFSHFYHAMPCLCSICHHHDSDGVTASGGDKCRWGGLKLVSHQTRYNSKTPTVASVVNLVRLQVCDTERPTLFAARLPRCSVAQVGQRWLILVVHDSMRIILQWSLHRIVRKTRDVAKARDMQGHRPKAKAENAKVNFSSECQS